MNVWRLLSFRIGIGLVGGVMVTGLILFSDRAARTAVRNRHRMLRLENEMFRAGVDTREYIRTQAPELPRVVDEDLLRAERELAKLPPREAAIFGALLEGYQVAWKNTVEAIRARGLGKETGAWGQLERSAQALEVVVKDLQAPHLEVLVLTARQAEKAYILESKPASIINLHAAIWSLEEEFRRLKKIENHSKDLSAAANAYERDFASLVARIKDIEERAEVLAEARLRMAGALRRVSTLETQSAHQMTQIATALLMAGTGAAMLLSILFALSIIHPLSQIRTAALALAAGETNLTVNTSGGGAELEAVGQALTKASRDIGQRMEAQAEAAEAQALARQVLDAYENGVIVLDKEFTVRMINPAVTDMLGASFNIQIGKSLLSGLPEELRSGALVRLSGALDGKVTRAKDEPLKDASGEVRWYSASNFPLRDKDAHVIGVVKTMQDVTDRKTRELELEEARRRAEEGQAAKDQFLNNVSHEVRTPLNGIIGIAEVLDVDTFDTRTREAIFLMQESAESLLTMIDGIIEYHEMMDEPRGFAVEAYRVDELLNSIRVQYLERAEQLHTPITLDCDLEGTHSLPVSSLQTMLRELVENALRYAPGAAIILSAQQLEDQRLRLAVTDNGPGISLERRDYIFDAFMQGDSSRSKGASGLGLGLAKVKRIAERIGACLAVESTPGQGSTFSIELSASIAAVKGTHRHINKPRQELAVLLVEDNLVNQVVARRVLESLGVSMEIAGNGKEAIEAVQRSDFDLIFMDLQMPEMDGLTATRQIRALPPENQQPFIAALTANNRPSDKLSCSEAGMDAFLAKPVRRAELDELLRRLTEPRSTLSS